jgi:hypothetical protein
MSRYKAPDFQPRFQHVSAEREAEREVFTPTQRQSSPLIPVVQSNKRKGVEWIERGWSAGR